MEIYLIRHTTPQVDKGICYGQLDLNVKDSFSNEANTIKKYLADLTFCKVYSSPLLRCQKLACELFPANTIAYSHLLKEINFGHWEGQVWNSISRDEMEQWSSDYVNNTVPGGESFGELIQRTNDFISQININANETIAIVTHSGVIRAFLVKYLQLPSTKVFNLELSYGCLIKITIHSDEYQQVKFIKA